MNGDLPRAEILHREALSMMERTLAPDDPRIAEVLFNLSAVVGGQRGRLGETENILHRCLEAQRQLHGVGGYNAVVLVCLVCGVRIVVFAECAGFFLTRSYPLAPFDCCVLPAPWFQLRTIHAAS